MTVCWCGRPPHDDLLDGCLGDPFLRALFGPPSVNAIIGQMVAAYGDLVAMALDDVEWAAEIIAANPIPEPTISMDRAFLRMAGMDVSDDDVRSLRDWHWPGHADAGSSIWG